MSKHYLSNDRIYIPKKSSNGVVSKNYINSKHLKKGVSKKSLIDSSSNYRSVGNKSVYSSLFAFFILILFMIVFSNYIRTGQFINFSFKSLLDYLSGMPDVSVTFASLDLTIYGDWGVFNFVKSFLNFFSGSFELLIMISGFGTQVLIVISYIVGLLFI